MQRVSKLFLICVVGLLAMVACAPVQQATESGAASVVAVPAVADEPAEAPVEEVAANAESAEIAAAPVLSAPTNDITLIGTTGRPQLLNSYTEW